MAGTTASPWGAAWPLLSLLCTIGSLACVAVPLGALTRRVARATGETRNIMFCKKKHLRKHHVTNLHYLKFSFGNYVFHHVLYD